MPKLPQSFYLNPDVVSLSKALLGKVLCTNIGSDGLTSGIIVETEAYAGATDKASHAYNNRRTNRTETMYAQGGICYVYLCYGIHHLFNIVVNSENIPHAVLIRAVEPLDGLDIMSQRRNKKPTDITISAGPGSLSAALGITTAHNSTDLLSDEIWIEDRGIIVKSYQITASPRVGVGYAKEDALLPWRFRIKDNPWTSKAR